MTDRTRSEALERSRRVRADVAATIPLDLPLLARLDWRMRVRELALFTTVVVAGMALSSWGRTHAQLTVSGLGIAVTAVGLNAFVLLMHEGMHGLLFPNRRWNWPCQPTSISCATAIVAIEWTTIG